jgi:predicted TPR repeat methyltransferase
MTRPLASYLEPWIADGDPLPETVTVNAADLLAAVGELRRMREVATEALLRFELLRDYVEHENTDADGYILEPVKRAYIWNAHDENAYQKLAAALAPADG